MDGSNALNIVFRIAAPVALVLAAALITRLWPATVIKHVAASRHFDMVSGKREADDGFTVLDNPLSMAEEPRTGLSTHQSSYVTSAADDAYVSYLEAQHQPPPWLQQGGRGTNYLADQKSAMQMQHEVSFGMNPAVHTPSPLFSF